MTRTIAQEAARAVELEPRWTVPSNDDIRDLLAERAQANVGVVVGVIDSTGSRVAGVDQRF